MRGLRWMATAATLAICCGLPSSASSMPLPSRPAVAAAKAKHRSKHKKKARKAPTHCQLGQARLQAGKKTICVTNKLGATNSTPQQAEVTTALTLELGKVRDKHGRHAPQLAKLLRRSGPNTLKSLEQTVSTGLARGETLALGSALGRSAHTARAPVAFLASSCNNPELEAKRKEYDEAPPAEKEKADREIAEAEKNSNFKNGEIEAKVDFQSGAIKLGIDTKANGIRIDMSLYSCGGDGLQIDNCPTAQGNVEGHDKSEVVASFKVSEGPKVLMAQSFKFKGETTIKAQTGDDGKLDSYDIKHIYSLVGSFGGAKAKFGPITLDITYIGEAHIDMRSASQQAPPAVVDVMAAMAGVDPAERIAAEIELAHKSQTEADKEFSAEVDKATAKLREKEAGWLKPNACASMHFEPASETLKLKKGQTGTFKSTTEASKGGTPPTATWTLSGQQNASFTPTGGSVNPLSSTYNVTNAGKGIFVSTVVKATSKAGVAEGTWKQDTEQGLTTITGTFSGSFHDQGEVVEWTGTATFTARESVPGGTVLLLSSSEVTAIASGFDGGGCKISGAEEVSPFSEGLWTINGEGEGLLYQIVAPFGYPGNMKVTLSDCPEPTEDGLVTTTSLGLAALQSGDPIHDGPTAMLKTSPDGKTFDGSATALGAEPDESYSWSWSFKGSP